MTVGELIEALQKGLAQGQWTPEDIVRTEGCDCDAVARTVEPDMGEGGVYITR